MSEGRDPMSDERRHAEEVADAIISHDDGDTNQGKWRARVADLIQRERADLLARAEAAEAERDEQALLAKEETRHASEAIMRAAGLRDELTAIREVTSRSEIIGPGSRNPTERMDYICQRCEMMMTRSVARGHDCDDLRAKLAAAEARVAEAQMERDAWRARAEVAEGARALSEAQANFQAACVQSVGAQRDEAITRAEVAEARVTELQTAWSTAVGWHSQGTAAIDRAEKAEAAAGQMRDLIRRNRLMLGEYSGPEEVDRVLATDAGRGYLSPEQVAQACAAARDAALEELHGDLQDIHAQLCGEERWPAAVGVSRCIDMVETHRALKGGTP